MVGHIMVPKVDPHYPASLSPRLIGVLRRIGFGGLIMTDSFSMVGVTNRFGLEECHRLAMAAGNDMVMTNYRIGARAAFEFMLKAYRDGCVSEAQIDAAVARVIVAQNRTLRQPTQTAVTQKDFDTAEDSTPPRTSPDVQSRSSCGRWNARRSTSMRGICSSSSRATRSSIRSPAPCTTSAPESGALYHERQSLDTAVDLLRTTFTASSFIKIDEFPSKAEMEHVLNATIPFESVVVVAYNRSVSYMGSSDLTHRLLALIDAISHKLSAVVLFGNPYAARLLAPVPRLIYGFDNALCQRYAILTLPALCHPHPDGRTSTGGPRAPRRRRLHRGLSAADVLPTRPDRRPADAASRCLLRHPRFVWGALIGDFSQRTPQGSVDTTGLLW